MYMYHYRLPPDSRSLAWLIAGCLAGCYICTACCYVSFQQILGSDVETPVLHPEILWISGCRLSRHPWPLLLSVASFYRGGAYDFAAIMHCLVHFGTSMPDVHFH